jgi:hypothetical protein
VAESDCGRVILVEVRKKQVKSSLKDMENFLEKVNAYQLLFPEKNVLPAFFSKGGFTETAKPFCETHGIGMAIEILHY